MIPLLAEDGAISNELFKWLAGGEAVAIVAMATYVVRLQATARSDMLANLPVLTLVREGQEALKVMVLAMTKEMADLRTAVESCRLK